MPAIFWAELAEMQILHSGHGALLQRTVLAREKGNYATSIAQINIVPTV